jgi:AraC family transcriptional regulator, positive regulator of tynA and feaB
MALFTTDSVRPKERLAYWREDVTPRLLPVVVEPAEGPFSAESVAKAVDGLILAESSASGGWAWRTEVEIADSPLPVYLANIHLAGPAQVRFGEDETTLKPGDVFFVDALKEVAFGGDRPFRCLAVMAPKSWIDVRVPRPDLVHGTVMRRGDPVSRLLAGYLRDGFETADRLSADAATLFAGHAAELISLALGQSRSAGPTAFEACREASFVRARRIVALECANPKLSPETIAARVGVSTRILHMIFAERGQSVMKQVYEERVRRAARLLASPEARGRTITEIAFACGFNDSAHFSRTFTARMGMTPSAWRKLERPATN